jgi:membrane-associated protease RseP (regulator of RpoE activity)
VSAVDECIDSSDPNEPCAQTPAVAAGIEPGDRVASLNGIDVSTYDEYKAAIGTTLTVDGDKYSAADVTVGVDRPGQGVITLPSAPGLVARFSDGEVRPYLGVYFESERVKVGPIGTLKDMGSMTWMSVQAIAKLPYYAWTTLRDLVTGAPRDPAGVMSVVGAARVAGEVASTNVLDSQSKLYLYLYLLGSINLFVGLLNLVPLLPFDGGYVAAGVYGVIRSAWAKLRRQPDPGPVDAAKLQPVAYVVGGFLVLMGAILIVADIFTPIHIF